VAATADAAEKTMTEVTTIECTFALSGRGFDPAEIDRDLGMTSTRIWRQRHAHLLVQADLPTVAWEYTIGPEPFDMLDEPVRRLVDLFYPVARIVTALADRLPARAAVVALVKLLSNRSAYVLSGETMRKLASLHAEFSMDLIDLRED
jgi:hypothetical protein